MICPLVNIWAVFNDGSWLLGLTFEHAWRSLFYGLLYCEHTAVYKFANFALSLLSLKPNLITAFPDLKIAKLIIDEEFSDSLDFPFRNIQIEIELPQSLKVSEDTYLQSVTLQLESELDNLVTAIHSGLDFKASLGADLNAIIDSFNHFSEELVDSAHLLKIIRSQKSELDSTLSVKPHSYCRIGIPDIISSTSLYFRNFDVVSPRRISNS